MSAQAAIARRSADVLPLRLLLWLALGLALVAAPHTQRLPWWINGTTVTMLLWRLYVGWERTELPHRLLLLAFALGQTIGVYFTFHTIFGRDAGVALLVLLMSLKLMETRAHRDVYVVIFLAYFVALTGFFYSQTIPTAAYMVLTVLVITAALVGFNARARPMLENLRTAGWMLVQAAPLMLLLFFLFPRVQGPLWGMPRDAFSGATGLSDTMSPGSISRLSQSDAIAFRVRFFGDPPPHNKRYWRGPVLSHFDGQTWSAGLQRLLQQVAFDALDRPVEYEVTLEPHNHNWLFALDLPARVPPDARMSGDYQLISLPPVRTRMRYQMRSYVDYRATGGADAFALRQALFLPPGFDPRARALAREWRSGSAGDDDAVVRRAIEFFRSSRFQYTLTPALLGRDSVDEFLFDTREGFCEHFASSFVFLMRAAGVPARVVTGYQGGEVNPVDGYMVVRESDAHAWAEVWLGERGWVRVDPTAAAVPLRIELGFEQAVTQAGALPRLIRENLGLLRSFRNNWEALANQWNQWVLGYNPDRQREMLSRFGMQEPSWQNLAVLLFWSVAALVLAIALWLLGSMRREPSAQRAWLRFCRKLAHAGVERGAAEGPLDYAGRASGRLPQRAERIRDIAGLYVELRYGRAAARDALLRFKQLVREFQP